MGYALEEFTYDHRLEERTPERMGDELRFIRYPDEIAGQPHVARQREGGSLSAKEP